MSLICDNAATVLRNQFPRLSPEAVAPSTPTDRGDVVNESSYTMYEPTPTFYPNNVKPPLNSLAIVSLITAVLGGAAVPVILGHIALAQIAKSGDRGRSAAIIGLVLGYLQIALIMIAVAAGLLDS